MTDSMPPRPPLCSRGWSAPLAGKVALVAGATPRRRPGHRGRARRRRGHRLLHRPHDAHRALRHGPRRDDRGDGRARRAGRRHRHRGAGRPPRARTGRGADRAHPLRAGRPPRPRERHLRRHHDGVGGDRLGIGPRRRAPPAAPRGRHPRDHEPLRAAAPARDPGRPGRRGQRRHGRVQRDQLPRLVLLRPHEGRGRADGVGARPRARGPHGATAVVAQPGVAAVGGDARGVRGDGGELARRHEGLAALRHLRDARLRRPRGGRARRRSRRRRAGTARRSRAGSSPRSTGSPISTAAGPTRGATWSRCRTPASRPTPPATAERDATPARRRYCWRSGPSSTGRKRGPRSSTAIVGS